MQVFTDPKLKARLCRPGRHCASRLVKKESAGNGAPGSAAAGRFPTMLQASMLRFSSQQPEIKVLPVRPAIADIPVGVVSLRWLGISDLIAGPEGPSFISRTVTHRHVDRRYS
jgi:hypothetical protein